MTSPVERLLAKLPSAKRNGRGWIARCPSHDDRRPSLSIAKGEDGRALIRCHAGCSANSICAAMGLTLRDLMADGTALTLTKPSLRVARKGSFNVSGENIARAGHPATTYPTADDAVAAIENRRGKRSAKWVYRNEAGDPVGLVLRWDLPDGKKILPVSRMGSYWIVGGMPPPRPLYRLPELADAGRVYITEGEKAADAALSIGLIATTSAHGSKSAGKTDWTPLAGRECVLLPDNDEAGRRYVDEVAAILATLTPAPGIKVVALPDLPPGGGHSRLRRGKGGWPMIRAEVETLADKAEPIKAERSAPAVEPFRPFPVDVLPEPFRGFVNAGAKAIGCDASYIALPLLAAAASAVGNTRRIQLKRGWTEPAIVWAGIVGDSGTLKSPAIEVALRGVRERQRKAMRDHAEAMNGYRDDLLRYERELGVWKKSKDDIDPPAKPEEPIADRCWTDDTTTEALAALLVNQWRGLLMVRDEMSGWIGGFDRYTAGRGSDVAKWLEMFHGRPMVVDRKTTGMIYVQAAAVSIVGGIQPETLRRVLGIEHRENGLAARLLMAWPPRCPKCWTEADIDPIAEAAVASILDRLYALDPAQDEGGDPRPIAVPLTADGKAAWIKFYNAHSEEQADLAGDLSAAWSKLQGYAARLALVVHFVRWAADDPTLSAVDAVDGASITAGVALTRWFGNEARRVYGMLAESDDDRDRRRLVELIRAKGGSVTPRDLMRSSRQYPTADDAERALADLAGAGLGRLESVQAGPRGGRPSKRFRLVDTVDGDETPNGDGAAAGIVNVNASNGTDDEWGEL